MSLELQCIDMSSSGYIYAPLRSSTLLALRSKRHLSQTNHRFSGLKFLRVQPYRSCSSPSQVQQRICLEQLLHPHTAVYFGSSKKRLSSLYCNGQQCLDLSLYVGYCSAFASVDKQLRGASSRASFCRPKLREQGQVVTLLPLDKQVPAQMPAQQGMSQA